jgi:hypothetical protein
MKRAIPPVLAIAALALTAAAAPIYGPLPYNGQAEPEEHSATKHCEIVFKKGQAPKRATAYFGQNQATDRNVPVTDSNSWSEQFDLAPAIPDPPKPTSYGPTTKTVTAGAASASTTNTVHLFTVDDNGKTHVNTEITLDTKVPGGKGGFARSRGRINFGGGKKTVTALEIDGVKINVDKKKELKKANAKLKKLNLWFDDPIVYRLLDPVTGATLQEFNLLEINYELSGVASFGVGDSDLLELSADPDGGAVAFSTSVPSYGTDLNGSISLVGGVFTPTGVFMPDSGLIEDYWILTYDGPDVTSAVLRPDVLTDSFNADTLSFEYSSLPIDPSLDPNRIVDTEFDISASLTEDYVPTPAAATLLLLAALPATRRARRG